MNKEYIRFRLRALDNYLNQNWKGLSDHFVERLLAISEHYRLLKELNK